MQKCFKGGTVKSKVVRYDEDKDVTLSFFNNVEIWKYRFMHPRKGTTPWLDISTEGFLNPCKSMIDPNAPGAFMINKPEDNPFCWAAVDGLLKRGVMSRACGEYFFHGSEPRGFSLKFAPCDKNF